MVERGPVGLRVMRVVCAEPGFCVFRSGVLYVRNGDRRDRVSGAWGRSGGRGCGAAGVEMSVWMCGGGAAGRDGVQWLTGVTVVDGDW